MPGRRRDLLERGRTRPSARRPAPAPAAARRGRRPARVASRRGSRAPGRRRRARSPRAAAPCARAAPRLRDVLARVDDEPVQPGRELRLAAELTDADAELHQRLLRRVARVLGVAQHVQRDLLDARSHGGRRAPRAPAGRRLSRVDQMGRRASRRRAASRAAGLAADWTALRRGRVARATTLLLVTDPLAPETVVSAPPRRFGRPYHLRRALRVDPAAARRRRAPRRGRPRRPPDGGPRPARPRPGSTRRARASSSRSLLQPPPPVADWPELSLVAAGRSPRRSPRRPGVRSSTRTTCWSTAGRWPGSSPRRRARRARDRDQRARRRSSCRERAEHPATSLCSRRAAASSARSSWSRARPPRARARRVGERLPLTDVVRLPAASRR